MVISNTQNERRHALKLQLEGYYGPTGCQYCFFQHCANRQRFYVPLDVNNTQEYVCQLKRSIYGLNQAANS
ncbi:hypothetical protein Plhal304r1_c012g0045561 [Plasmopara halstedii]